MIALNAIPARSSNPFSTCWTRPGAMPYLASSRASVHACIQQLQASRWRGQIVGPHGVGKSTLLCRIDEAARALGIRTVRWRADRKSPLPQLDTEDQVLLVDSYEVLGPWRRRRLLRRPSGLVVTTHRNAGLPTLATLSPTLDESLRLFEHLVERTESPVKPEDLGRSYHRHRGNLREVWFDLYDLHERRTRRC